MNDNENDKLLFQHDGPCILYHNNVVFDGVYGKKKDGELLRAIAIHLTGPHAQYDKSILVYATPPRKRKMRVYRIIPDGLVAFSLEIEGQIVWDSSDELFPVYCSLEAARDARAKEHELVMSRYDLGWTAGEYWAKFVALVEETNAKFEQIPN